MCESTKTTFIDAAMDLKDLPRQGWVEAGVVNPESVAAHSYGAAVLAMFMADSMGLDAGKILRMTLLHDMAESITGDIIPGSMPPEDKKERESRAMNRILCSLPKPIQDMYHKTWEEYTMHDSPESILVHDADKLDMALQAKRYAKAMNHETFLSFIESSRQGIRNRQAMNMMHEAGL